MNHNWHLLPLKETIILVPLCANLMFIVIVIIIIIIITNAFNVVKQSNQNKA